MPHFSESCLNNRAYCSRAGAFNAQLPLGGSAGTRLGDAGTAVPPGVTMLPDGSALVRFFAPAAREVSLRIGEERYALTREGDLWQVTVPYTTPGFRAFFLEVDGCQVLHPLAPIGFGWSQPVNYIDFPEEEADFYQLRPVPHGTLAQEIYFSSVTGNYEACTLYLPPDYMAGQNRYPVLYLQHGHGENEKCWLYQGKVNFILDNLIAEGKAVPCIVVMNNGMVHTVTEAGELCMDASLLEDVLLRDCIPFIDGKYRTIPDREHRAMAGLSMGSMQTSIATMDHPELFAYAGIFSGFLRSFINDRTGNAHLKAMDDPDFPGRYKVFFRAMGEDDEFRDSFTEDSAFMAARGLAPEQWPAHRIVNYPGRHEWQVWRKCIRDFLPLLFR